MVWVLDRLSLKERLAQIRRMAESCLDNCVFWCLFHIISVNVVAFSPQKYSPCISKDFGHGGTVCVCSEDYCDSFIEGTQPLLRGQYAVYTSCKAGDRLRLSIRKFCNTSGSLSRPVFVDDSVKLTINKSVVYQTILGFGGAFTDAATINILNISTSLQKKLMSSYYSECGIEYSIGRIPMASCDFSTRPYSYDDFDGDFVMANFSLAKEDLQFKIPVILSAINMSKRNIIFFGSPWSAPAWMKTNGEMTGFGQLKGQAGDKYHKAWALYFAKFIEAYTAKGVKIWGVTVQNEPSDGFIPEFSFQCMGFTAEMERDFIKEDLGPILSSRGHTDVRVMILDDERPFVPHWADAIFADPEAAKYVSGIAIHWYWDNFFPPSILTDAHNKYPDYFILATEACTSSDSEVSTLPKGVSLGNWSRGNEYSHSIIQDLSNWSVGWVDWNLALNLEGGPNWVKNFVDSPIVVDAENGVFYKQPMYYHLGHFSKFIPPGSQRINVTSSEKTSLEFIGFVTPQSDTVVVVLNTDDKEVPFEITDPDQGVIKEVIPPLSTQTYVW